MSKLIPRPKGCATAAILLLLHGIGPSADSVRYNPVAREHVEARLRRYGGDNRQREATLKKMFVNPVATTSTRTGSEGIETA